PRSVTLTCGPHTPPLYALPLLDALPIFRGHAPHAEIAEERETTSRIPWIAPLAPVSPPATEHDATAPHPRCTAGVGCAGGETPRSEEHTSELQSREKLVCRRLLDNKNVT